MSLAGDTDTSLVTALAAMAARPEAHDGRQVRLNGFIGSACEQRGLHMNRDAMCEPKAGILAGHEPRETAIIVDPPTNMRLSDVAMRDIALKGRFVQEAGRTRDRPPLGGPPTVEVWTGKECLDRWHEAQAGPPRTTRLG